MTLLRKWLIALCVPFSTHTMATDAVDSLLQQLQSMDNFQAMFVQTTRDPTGAVLQQMRGELIVERPGKMRWETEEPFAQLVVSDGTLLWIYDTDLEQVTIRSMGQRIQETPALLLSGDASEIRDGFTVSMTKMDDVVRYRLTPNDNSQLFEALQFSYRAQRLSAMTIDDATGQVTEITFRQQTVNATLPEHTFLFEVPEGVDIIDARNAR
ncbi:MAG: outer membrane lipoprotein chaperone LolA [Bacterioplanes sp.]|nr:outer membrane lipoprotein chaperone LolA [Bacterioplanes sp.]